MSAGMILLAAIHTDVFEFLSGASDFFTGRDYVCPNHGHLDPSDVRQVEPNRYLYSCAKCGEPVAQEIPF